MPPIVPVRFHIIDRNKRIDVTLPSNSYSVELGPKVMKMVDATEGDIAMSVSEK